MTQDITPFSFGKSGIRWVHLDGEDWAVLNDFCEYIKLTKSQARKYAQTLPKEVVRQADVLDSRGATQKTNIINKRGIAIILRTSNADIPKAFQEWLGTEVFESIVEEGGYLAPWATMEQLARVQEKIDYSMLRNMLAKAVDYDSNAPITRFFFAIAQDAFYKATLGLTAKGILASGRDIVTYEGKTRPTKKDLSVAKNYLDKDELELLGLYVTNAITQTRLRFHKKEYTMDEFVDAVKESLKKFWEK